MRRRIDSSREVGRETTIEDARAARGQSPPVPRRAPGRISRLTAVRCGMGVLPISGGRSKPRARRSCYSRPEMRSTVNREMSPKPRAVRAGRRAPTTNSPPTKEIGGPARPKAGRGADQRLKVALRTNCRGSMMRKAYGVPSGLTPTAWSRPPSKMSLTFNCTRQRTLSLNRPKL